MNTRLFMTASTSGIKYYFSILFKMANRRIRDFGLNPVLSHILIVILFALLSEVIFYKSPLLAPYILSLGCFFWQLSLSQKDRSDFLLITFGDKAKIKIRIIENLLVFIPFAIVLTIKGHFIVIGCLLVLSILLAFVTLKTIMNFTLPTPFSKRPFEFATGFRKTFFIFPFLYAVAVISVCVSNLNLGLISMPLIFVIMSYYYIKPENEYYVWIFARSPKSFLLGKVLNAMKNATFLSLPVFVLLIAFFYAETLTILLFFIAGLIFIISVILGKYSTYPDEIGIPEGIALAGVLFFPPLALIIIPFFYFRSINSLRRFLND